MISSARDDTHWSYGTFIALGMVTLFAMALITARRDGQRWEDLWAVARTHAKYKGIARQRSSHMKRKVYATPRERKADQLMGFWAFPIVNVPLWIVYQMLYSRLPEVTATGAASLGQIRTLVSAMPWLVNGILLVLAFFFRPQLGVGYVTFAAIAFTVVGALSMLFMAACFVSLFSAGLVSLAVTQLLDELCQLSAHYPGAFLTLWEILGIALFVALMLGGMYGLALLGRSLFQDWQSSGEDTPEAGGVKIA